MHAILSNAQICPTRDANHPFVGCIHTEYEAARQSPSGRLGCQIRCHSVAGLVVR